MESYDIDEVRYAVSSLLENFNSFISLLSDKSVTHRQYRNYLHSIYMELSQIWGEFDILKRKDEKYDKAYENIRKILIKLVIDTDKLEEKCLGRDPLLWEHKFEEEKNRKKLIKFHQKTLKQLKEIHKII